MVSTILLFIYRFSLDQRKKKTRIWMPNYTLAFHTSSHLQFHIIHITLWRKQSIHSYFYFFYFCKLYFLVKDRQLMLRVAQRLAKSHTARKQQSPFRHWSPCSFSHIYTFENTVFMAHCTILRKPSVISIIASPLFSTPSIIKTSSWLFFFLVFAGIPQYKWAMICIESENQCHWLRNCPIICLPETQL